MKWLIVLVIFLLVGCSNEPVSINPVTENTESPAQIKKTLSQSPLSTIQPRKFSKGEALYINYCADCHGWEGRGSGHADKFLDIPVPILLRNELLAEKSENQFVDWVLSGSALQLQLAEDAVPQTDTEVAVILAYIKKLPTIDWSKIEAGQKVYDELCLSCHGLYGHGDGGLAYKMPGPLPDLSALDYQTQHSDEDLLQIIAKGKDAMPGTEDVLNTEEINSVIAFVRLLSPGYESYDRFCVVCHGADGTPMQIVALNEDEEQGIEFSNIDLPTFDDAYIKAHTDEQLILKIQHMLGSERVTMPHFAGYIKQDEVREIFRYLSGLLSEYP